MSAFGAATARASTNEEQQFLPLPKIFKSYNPMLVWAVTSSPNSCKLCIATACGTIYVVGSTDHLCWSLLLALIRKCNGVLPRSLPVQWSRLSDVDSINDATFAALDGSDKVHVVSQSILSSTKVAEMELVLLGAGAAVPDQNVPFWLITTTTRGVPAKQLWQLEDGINLLPHMAYAAMGEVLGNPRGSGHGDEQLALLPRLDCDRCTHATKLNENGLRILYNTTEPALSKMKANASVYFDSLREAVYLAQHTNLSIRYAVECTKMQAAHISGQKRGRDSDGSSTGGGHRRGRAMSKSQRIIRSQVRENEKALAEFVPEMWAADASLPAPATSASTDLGTGGVPLKVEQRDGDTTDAESGSERVDARSGDYGMDDERYSGGGGGSVHGGEDMIELALSNGGHTSGGATGQVTGRDGDGMRTGAGAGTHSTSSSSTPDRSLLAQLRPAASPARPLPSLSPSTSSVGPGSTSSTTRGKDLHSLASGKNLHSLASSKDLHSLASGVSGNGQSGRVVEKSVTGATPTSQGELTPPTRNVTTSTPHATNSSVRPHGHPASAASANATASAAPHLVPVASPAKRPRLDGEDIIQMLDAGLAQAKGESAAPAAPSTFTYTVMPAHTDTPPPPTVCLGYMLVYAAPPVQCNSCGATVTVAPTGMPALVHS